MATGLLALLDDIAGIAKAAAASVDDIAAQAMKAGSKAAGVVIDDAAVAPAYVVGFAAERELPIVGKIAVGSLRNKLLFLLPAALLLSAFAEWAITPLLMFGGLFLCYEGAEKVYEALFPHKAHGHESKVHAAKSARELEDQKVRSAIKTDFILSAEIMAITLASLDETNIVLEAVILAIVGAAITVIVYGAVALIVKADDAGLALAQADNPAPIRKVGRGIVVGMPVFLRILSIVGTAAMIWVGGGLLVHGTAELGWHWPEEIIHDAAVGAADALSGLAGFIEWLVTAAFSAVVGLTVGALLIPVVEFVVSPLASRVFGLFGREPAAH